MTGAGFAQGRRAPATGDPLIDWLRFVVPAGALGVGLCAGSGYGLASWFTGVKISRGLLWAVVAMQVLVYFAAQYLRFRELVQQTGMTELSFLGYFDLITQSMAWKSDSGGVGSAFGLWGYAFRALEIAGFAAGSLVVPAWARGKPFCEGCQVYMRTRHLGRLPAGTPARKVGKGADAQAAFEEDHRQGFEAGVATLEQLQRLADAGDVPAFRAELGPHLPKKSEYQKLTTRIEVSLVSCSRCSDGWVASSLVSGQGEHVAVQHLPSVRAPVDFVRALRKPV